MKSSPSEEATITTIAYAKGIMASDSSAWEGGTLAHSTKKLYRLKDGGVAGIYGTLHACINLIEYLNDPTKKPKNLVGAGAIVAYPDGSLKSYEGATMVPIVRANYLAAGSGMTVALGALYSGAGAKVAVKAAIAHDSNSRGPVVWMRVKTGTVRKNGTRRAKKT